MSDAHMNLTAQASQQKGSLPNSSKKIPSKSGVMQKATDDDTREIDLLQVFRALRAQIVWIILAALLGGGIAWGYTHFFCTRQYKSKSVIYLVSASNSVLNLSDLQIGNGIANDYATMIKSRSVLLAVADNLGLDYTFQQMSDIIQTENPNNTHIMNIYATCSDPELAKSIANETARVSIKKISEVMEISSPNIIDEAIVSTTPASPNVSKNTLIGLLLGALLVAAFVVFRCVTDRTIKNSDDLEQYCGLVTLTKVPDMNRHSSGYGYSSYYGGRSGQSTDKRSEQKGGSAR